MFNLINTFKDITRKQKNTYLKKRDNNVYVFNERKGKLVKLKKDNGCGKYKIDKETGKLVKMSNFVQTKDHWFEKWKIDGNKDMEAGYVEIERKGNLHKVNDREVWQEFADR